MPMAAVAHVSHADLRCVPLVGTGPVARARPPAARSAAPVRAAQVSAAPVRAAQVSAATVSAATVRRRRSAALVVLVTAAAVIGLAVQGLLAAFGGGPLIAPQRPGPPAAVHVVQPGDTFWDIARGLRPGQDPRPLVAELVAAHGSPVLVPGQRLGLPGAG
jgi:LysM repeat protein